MKRAKYIKLAYINHLDEKNTYVEVNETQALNLIKSTKRLIFEIVNKAFAYYNLPDHVKTFLKRMINKKYQRTAQFYQSIKMHKLINKFEKIDTRPIISQPGTRLANAAQFVHHYLQSIIPTVVSSYVPDSFSLRQQLEYIGTLPPNARLFTCDAVSAFTCADTEHAHLVFNIWLTKLERENKLPNNFPVKLILDLTYLITTHNLFQFGKNYYLQKSGSAIGSPYSNNYLNFYVGYLEEVILNPIFKDNILLDKRVVDSKLVIWIGTIENYQNYQNY